MTASYREQLVKFKEAKLGQTDVPVGGRRKKHRKAGDWLVVVGAERGLFGGREWIRTYATQEIAERVAAAYNRRFDCHPAPDMPWGGSSMKAIVRAAASLGMGDGGKLDA